MKQTKIMRTTAVRSIQTGGSKKMVLMRQDMLYDLLASRLNLTLCLRNKSFQNSGTRYLTQLMRNVNGVY